MFAPGKLTSYEVLEGQNGEECTTVPLHFLIFYKLRFSSNPFCW